jgi:hypothetical protein
MLQLAVTLATLTLAATQMHAGILDWLFGSPDPLVSWQRGIARLRQHEKQIFGSELGIYPGDVKKTDSLIEPIRQQQLQR